MGKQQKKSRQTNRNHHDFSAVKKNFSSIKAAKKAAPSKPPKKGTQTQAVKPVVPFSPSDRILLVGEGQSSHENISCFTNRASSLFSICSAATYFNIHIRNFGVSFC
jgi:hypothetical protein